MSIKISRKSKNKIKNALKYILMILGTALSIITRSSFDEYNSKNCYTSGTYQLSPIYCH
ncbi:MAG: hypothetical protein ACTSRZ_07545 [Promethearchaeota archaeon]